MDACKRCGATLRLCDPQKRVVRVGRICVPCYDAHYRPKNTVAIDEEAPIPGAIGSRYAHRYEYDTGFAPRANPYLGGTD